MKARLGFGLREEKGELWFSSEHWLEDFEFDQFPPVGLVLRFDVPEYDDDGRWYKNPDSSYFTDGGNPIRENQQCRGDGE